MLHLPGFAACVVAIIDVLSIHEWQACNRVNVTTDTHTATAARNDQFVRVRGFVVNDPT
jgi:hypothetical protein